MLNAMAPARVGLMGFGRIGRNVMRLLQDREDLEVVAIHDIADPKGLAYLLKYDSLYGRFRGEIRTEDGALIIDDRRIRFGSAKEPKDTDWGADEVDIVLETTSRYRSRDSLQEHIDHGGKKVVLTSSPETPGEVPLLLSGINDEILEDDPSMVALGSNTANAAAPILKTINRTFGIERAFITTVKAMSNSGRLADVPTDSFRTSRSAAENIIPSDTNSAEIIYQALPELTDRLLFTSLNVPVPDGSNVDMVAETSREVTAEEVNEAIAQRVADRYSHVIEYTEDPIVSTDVRMNSHSGVFDSLATMVTGGTLLKTVIWFNNGWGYSHRVVEVAARMAKEMGP
jgi:glyceraldehyde 3-phosphate dehydrogenase